MSVRPAIGFDLDGVLSNFIGPFQIMGRLLLDAEVDSPRRLSDQEVEQIIRSATSPGLASSLSDPEDYYGDLPPEAFEKVFQFVDLHQFRIWASLPCFATDDERLKMVGLNAFYNIHYITSRRGDRGIVREATFHWLQRRGFPIADIERIHVVGTKGITSYRLGIQAFIDDDPGKCASLRMAHVPCIFMCDRRYNRDIDVGGVTRTTLSGYLSFLEENAEDWRWPEP